MSREIFAVAGKAPAHGRTGKVEKIGLAGLKVAKKPHGNQTITDKTLDGTGMESLRRIRIRIGIGTGIGIGIWDFGGALWLVASALAFPLLVDDFALVLVHDPIRI